MADNKSIYSRGGTGMTTGGLDGYLGPEAQDFSNLPEEIDEDEKTPQAAGEVEVDCAGKDKDQAVCQIAEAEEMKKTLSGS